MPDTTAVRTLGIDKAHSEALFQVRHLVTKVRGRFADIDGTIRLDEAHPEQSSVTFTMKTASVDTNEPDRDKHLRSEDFFHAEKFPSITFASASIARVGDNQFNVIGDLTIRGVAKRITLPVTFLGAVKDPWGNTKWGFEAETTLNRKDFGLIWNAALEMGGFLLGDEVKVTLEIQAAAKQ